MHRPALFLALLSSLASAAPVALFDGKSFAGWQGETSEVWRIEDGAITGGSLAGNPHNEFLATGKPYKNFALRLEYKLTGTEGFINGGVQFHSERVANPPYEMTGYQADIGAKFTGFLYDESRRNKVLAPADVKLVESLEKSNDWNVYEVRAEGDRVRISLNGTQTIDYTEIDPKIPHQGLIALQIHGNSKAVISFRNITIDALPDDIVPDTSQILNRFGSPATPHQKPAPWTNGKADLLENETFVFAGQTNFVQEQKSGGLEAALSIAWQAKKPVFRSMAWQADTVYEQWRDLNFGSWEGQLEAAGATAVIAQFGQMEALDGLEKLPAFTAAYHRLLDQFAQVTPRLILVSPMPFEKPVAAHAPDLTQRNGDAKAYADAVREIARQRGAIFVDLFTPLANADRKIRLTDDGIHLTQAGLDIVADLISKQLGAGNPTTSTPALRLAISEKNRLWFDCWRPANWSFVYGDRISQPFGKPGGDAPSLRAAFEQHKLLIAAMDARIQALARGETPAAPQATPAPKFDAMKPISPEEQMAAFKLRDGYEINLFADETLGVAKPTQFSWDEKGRLFVACSPTYPQTLPGIAPSDYILVLQDTDGDGRADKSSRFAEGLTMVQGLEPGDGGLYVCDFDQILFLKDTDGDGRADQKTVLLSGFGIGDTHQLVNSICHGPDGCLWFTQGLHAFSRVETPWGISRLDKAGVWKFNPRTLKLESYFNGGTAGHNCWGVAFDDFFQPFHKSGDRPHGYYSLPGLIPLADPDDYHSVSNLFESSPKTTALEIIGTRALPADIQGNALIGGYFGSVVELHQLIDDGAGFNSVQMPKLLTSSDTSFRPVDVGVGPDGAIYLADWFNPVIGHYQASYADPRRDRSHGRIWRITAKGLPSIKQPDLASMTATALLDQLRSPERWTRDQARRLLFAKPTPEVIKAADAWIATLDPKNSADEPLLMQACAIYQSHQTVRSALLEQLLKATDFRVRAYATRVIGDWNKSLPAPLDQLAKSIHDPHPRVRLEAIVASSHIPSPATVNVTVQALESPGDRFINYALKQTVRSLEPLWQPALATGSLKAPANPQQAAYLKQIATARPTAEHPGKIIYESLCLNCHQPAGTGLPGVYPPLTPNEWISSSDPSVPVRILLHGLTGPITVGKAEYGVQSQIPMPPMGLNDQQLSDILSYVRSNFGNMAAPISAAEVKKIRESYASRATFWTAAELKK